MHRLVNTAPFKLYHKQTHLVRRAANSEAFEREGNRILESILDSPSNAFGSVHPPFGMPQSNKPIMLDSLNFAIGRRYDFFRIF